MYPQTSETEPQVTVSRADVLTHYPEVDFKNIQTPEDWSAITSEPASSWEQVLAFYAKDRMSTFESFLDSSKYDTSSPKMRLRILSWLYKHMPFFAKNKTMILGTTMWWMLDMNDGIYSRLSNFVEMYGEDFDNCQQTHGLRINLSTFRNEMDIVEDEYNYVDVIQRIYD